MASGVSLEGNWEMINGSDQYLGSTTIDQNNLRSSSGNPFCHNSATEITNPDYNYHSFPNNSSTNIVSFGNLSSATSVSPPPPPPHDHHVTTTSSSRGEIRFQMQQPQNFPVSDTQQLYAYEESVKGSTSSCRTSLEAQYHVMAERKRREKLSQLFLSLSTMIPGLKTLHKASILGGTINYLKELEERLKTLEQDRINKKKKIIENISDMSSSQQQNQTMPEIEVRICGSNVLVRVYCTKRSGIIKEILCEIEKLHICIINSSVLPFGGTNIHISIIGEMNGEFCMAEEDLAEKIKMGILNLM
ncbi:hypothetical protein M9H77_05636 [Catharanthus roseus]|uniref:Uncharacterized protein n=1 Tax=Catharanthus roseus TaxID=4058 RepID=A0ACC0CHX6_CATRO|nr:hypothetical protein M9H77_05636 [Catharanthus roseus]